MYNIFTYSKYALKSIVKASKFQIISKWIDNWNMLSSKKHFAWGHSGDVQFLLEIEPETFILAAWKVNR